MKKYLPLFMSVVTGVAAVNFLSTCCSRTDHSSRLLRYIKAEKELRIRVSQERGLEDSIQALQKKYRLNLEKEIIKMKNSPDALKKLLETLAGKK